MLLLASSFCFCLILLFLLIVKFHINSGIVLIGISLLLGILNNVPIPQLLKAIYTGFLGQCFNMAPILIIGSLLGKILDISGIASQISFTLTSKINRKHIIYAIQLAAIMIGITMFFEVAFIIMLPMMYSLSQKIKLPLLNVAVPCVIGLSMTHSFLPPHPGPLLVCNLYGANISSVLLWGIFIVLFISLSTKPLTYFLLGLIHTKTFPSTQSTPISCPATSIEYKNITLSPTLSIFCGMLPIMGIIGMSSIGPLAFNSLPIHPSPNAFSALGMLLSIVVICCLLTMTERMMINGQLLRQLFGNSISSIWKILFVICAGGTFKQVLSTIGFQSVLVEFIGYFDLSPIIVAWGSAAFLRFVLGSATVAVTAAAGITAGILSSYPIPLEIMALATTTGSIFASHVNDPGFWVFKEYMHLSLPDAIKIRTTYTCILSFMGLILVLLINRIFF